MNYGENLKRMRTSRNLSQQDLADRLKINRSTYARYELGNTQPDYDTLKKLADFFEVSTDYLLGRTNNPNEKTSNEPFEDPDVQLAYKEFAEASEESRNQAIDFLRWLKQQEKGRKPGDRQKK